MVWNLPIQPVCWGSNRNNDTKLGVVSLVTHTCSNIRRTKECQPIYHIKANHVDDDKDTETFIKPYNENDASSVKNTNIVMDSEHVKEDPLIHPKEHESSIVTSSVKPKDYIPSTSKRKFLKCKYCEYEGDSRKKFKRHVEKLHLPAKTRTPVVLQCEICTDFSTKYKKSLLYHQQNSCPSLSHVVWFDAWKVD